MGNSLHNKIYLGRTTLLGSRRVRALLALSAAVSIGIAWIAFHGLK